MEFVESRHWQEAEEAETAKMKWLAELIASINKTVANSAEATIKTIAGNR